MVDAAIEFDRVSFSYPDKSPGLADVSLVIRQGEFVLVCGKNGSGKTTLLRHMNALLFPTRGEVRVFGESTRKKPAAARVRVGMVFADTEAQIVGETVAGDTAFGPRNLKLPPREVEARVERALEAVGLAAVRNKRPEHLSGGEKQKLAVAGVLAMDPDVIVFDEPFSNLDLPGVLLVRKEMCRLAREGVTLVVTTHDPDKVLDLSTRLLVLDQGRLERDVPSREAGPELLEMGVLPPCGCRRFPEPL